MRKNSVEGDIYPNEKIFLKDKSLSNIDDDQFRYQDYANNLRKIIECTPLYNFLKEVTSYDNLIIQRQTHNWQAFSIFFCLFFHFCRPYGGQPVFTDISYTGDGVRRFHPLPLQTFFVRHNRKIPECFLLCLLLCKSRLLRLYECYRQTGSAAGSGRSEVPASLPAHR